MLMSPMAWQAINHNAVQKPCGQEEPIHGDRRSQSTLVIVAWLAIDRFHDLCVTLHRQDDGALRAASLWCWPPAGSPAAIW